MRALIVILLCCFASMSLGCSKGEVNHATPTPKVRGLRNESGVGGPLFKRATSSKDVDPYFQSGEEVFITDGGFKPKQLIAKVHAEIVFINETATPKAVRFVNGAYRSGEIAAERSASFTPEETVSIVYELVGSPKVRGAIQVESYYEPGETATPEAQH